MKLLQRSAIVVVTLAGVLASGTTPASAIVSGRDATQNYPGMAAISVVFPGLGTAKCGASLIHPRFLLTAAHCVSDQQAAPTPVAVPGANITVRIGSNDRTTGGVVATGKQVYLHPDWMWGLPTGRPVSDLALVELTRDVPSALMSVATRQAVADDPVRLIGWGLTEFPPVPGTTLPTMLQQRDTTRLPAAACSGGFIGEAEICVDAGACFGDSGGPALHQLSGGHVGRRPSWASIGIASRESSEDNPCGAASVYTDATYAPFRFWTLTTILKRKALPCTCPLAASMDLANVARLKLLRPLIVG